MLTNDAGQDVESLDYHDLTGVTYAVAAATIGSGGTNFHRTRTAYDGRGRVKRVETPTGTVHRYRYNGRGQLTEEWVGTDDAPASGTWSPANTAGTDLTRVLEHRYDGRRAGVDAPAAPVLSAAYGNTTGPARTIYVRISYLTADGESFGSPEASITLYDGDAVRVSAPPAVAGATAYNVYVGEQPGELHLGQFGNSFGSDFAGIPEPGQPFLYTTLNPGTGLGHRTATIRHPTGATDAAADRVDLFYYDWRGRLVATKGGARLDAAGGNDTANEAADAQRPIAYYEYDNLGLVTAAYAYDGDGQAVTRTAGVPDKPAASLLRGMTTTARDEWGRAYETRTFGVDPATGTPSAAALTAGHWFDARGNLLKSAEPGGLVSKWRYDGAGRVTQAFATDGGGDAGHGHADDVDGDAVLEQTAYTYDANGNVTLTAAKQRFHDAAGTGELGGAATEPKARAYYSAGYYDALDRPTAAVDAGTNGGTAYARPGTPPTLPDPALVTRYAYDAAGRPLDVTDPRGIVGRTAYDLLGRATSVTEAYTDGTPSPADDRITRYTYDGMDHVLTMTADLPSGQADQTTAYVYGVTAGGGSSVTSNDLLREVRYPSASGGTPGTGAGDKKVYAYTAAGEVKTLTDQNGNVHTYAYDVLGRTLSDAVTTLGSGVDGAVRRLETAYDTQGNAHLFTSYDAASGGSVVNQVLRQFNGLGQVTAEFQAHAGAVDTGTTPKVGYAYTEMASGANHSRLTSMTYPNGRELQYAYDLGVDGSVSRVSRLMEGDSSVLEDYGYEGVGRIVYKGRPNNFTETAIAYDRFGRVEHLRWVNIDTSAATDDFTYGYDRGGNPLYKANGLQAGMSELYHADGAASGYDALGRLTEFQRGTLSDSNSDGVPDTVATTTRSQGWSLDPLGNSMSVTTDGTPEARTHDDRNRLTGAGSAQLTFDAAGNTTVDDAGKAQGYDAWNRLVVTKSGVGGTTIATQAYDALGRRVTVTPAGGTATSLFYTTSWQVAEERQAGVTTAAVRLVAELR